MVSRACQSLRTCGRGREGGSRQFQTSSGPEIASRDHLHRQVVVTEPPEMEATSVTGWPAWDATAASSERCAIAEGVDGKAAGHPAADGD